MSTKRKVILVYPKIDYEENYKYSWTPFSILALAGVLEQRGFEPVLLDQNSEPGVDWFSRLEPHLNEALCVGFSVMTGGGQIQHALALAAQVREYRPSMPLIWGGPHVSALPEQTARHPLVDIAVAGQGDFTLSEIAQGLQEGFSLASVSGLYVKDSQGAIKLTPRRAFVRKDDLPTYPWHLVHPGHYIRNDVTINTRTFGYVSSQGCPYRCRFCYEFAAYNAWWSGFEADRLVDDIAYLAQEFDINGVKFYDADFFVKGNRVENFCRSIQERNLRIKWAGSANPNDLLRMHSKRPQLLDLIRETNCTRILMGLESGSESMLELIDKRVTPAQLKEVVQIITDYGIIGSFTFIVGFPGETVGDLQATLDFIEYIHSLEARHETRVHIFAPYPGTPLFETAISYGFHPHTEFQEWSDYNYYQPQTPWVDDKFVEIVREYTRMH